MKHKPILLATLHEDTFPELRLCTSRKLLNENRQLTAHTVFVSHFTVMCDRFKGTIHSGNLNTYCYCPTGLLLLDFSAGDVTMHQMYGV